jgi:hypothetical protein
MPFIPAEAAKIRLSPTIKLDSIVLSITAANAFAAANLRRSFSLSITLMVTGINIARTSISNLYSIGFARTAIRPVFKFCVTTVTLLRALMACAPINVITPQQ